MAAILKIVFGHNSAADWPISVKFCVDNGTEPRISCFPNAVLASASGAFRIVCDTLLYA